MLLAVDVGNTNIMLGLFDGGALVKDWRVETVKADLPGRLREKFQLDPSTVDAVAIASVVPPLDSALEKFFQQYLGKEPLWVTHQTAGMPLRVEAPEEVGADRLCNAVAAWEKFKQACIIVDFGTATTFDVVTARGEYGGGPIAPGVVTAGNALTESASKLPEVKIEKPRRVVGRNTVECMQSGLYYGYAGLVDRLVELIQKEEGSRMKVIATGGLASMIAQESKWIEGVEPHLTLEGLHSIYQAHCGNSF